MSNAAAPPQGSVLTRAQVVAWRNAVFGIFGLCGLGLSSWVARTPSVRDSLHASTGEMGLIVFGLAMPVTADALIYQWADTTRIASGRGVSAPKARQASV